MAEKVTTMVLKVDLQCHLCYKKIKKILCKFPQIRDQIYDEKKNTVTIIVVCCSPEKVRDKLCCKGGKTIKSIEIIEPPKPKPSPPPEKPPAPAPAPAPPPEPKNEKPKDLSTSTKPHAYPNPPAQARAPAPAPAPKPPPPVPKCLEPTPILVCNPPMYPVGICCGQCYEGRNDGPRYQGYGRLVPSYDNDGYGPSGYGGNRGCYTRRCDYFSEENTSGCTIM